MSTAEAVAEAPAPFSKALLIAALLNILAILGTGGFFYYTRFIFKRPAITETKERERIITQHKEAVASDTPTYINFDPTTMNIEAIPASAAPTDGAAKPVASVDGKLHYATIAFAIEINDEGEKNIFEDLRTIIMDRVISIVGKKKFQELATVQGRYLLRTQILDSVRQLKIPAGLVTNIYFTTFIVQ